MRTTAAAVAVRSLPLESANIESAKEQRRRRNARETESRHSGCLARSAADSGPESEPGLGSALGKGQMGSALSTNGVTAIIFMFFDRGTFLDTPVSLLLSSPKCQGVPFSPNLALITFAAAPLVSTLFVRNRALLRPSGARLLAGASTPGAGGPERASRKMEDGKTPFQLSSPKIGPKIQAKYHPGPDRYWPSMDPEPRTCLLRAKCFEAAGFEQALAGDVVPGDASLAPFRRL